MTSTRRGAAALLAAVALTATGLALAAPSAVAAPDPDRVPGAWIVTLADDASPDAVAADHGRRYAAQVDRLYRHALKGYAARMSDTAAAKVAQDSRVLSVEPDRVVTTAALKPGGGETVQAAAAQPLPTGIDRVDGELSSVVAGDGLGTAVAVDVAVIDTGIAAHPDLTIAGGKNCASGKSYSDGNGHGTHVAGTIGAKDNSAGVVGVAPGARLWAVRVLDNRGSGTTSSVICGIDWVTGMAGTIEVANMSLGGGGTDRGCAGDAYHAAVCRSVSSGVTYVVAAGNSSADAATSVPAAFDEVVTVSALADFDGAPGGLAAATCRADVDDTFADFSNYGADVDLIAPGVCINSTWLNGGYNSISGTSMASPHVAGAAALFKSVNKTASPADVKRALLDTTKEKGPWAGDRDSIPEPLLNVDAF